MQISIILISLLFGIWLGAALAYFVVIKPLIHENDELKRIQKIKKKFDNEFQLKQEEYE
jgi:hypothetical protein